MSGNETIAASGNEVIDDYADTAPWRLESRCLFACSDSRVGLGSLKVQPGDEVMSS
jgi:hypothetical protein